MKSVFLTNIQDFCDSREKTLTIVMPGFQVAGARPYRLNFINKPPKNSNPLQVVY
jgi:hypothetical protein